MRLSAGSCLPRRCPYPRTQSGHGPRREYEAAPIKSLYRDGVWWRAPAGPDRHRERGAAAAARDACSRALLSCIRIVVFYAVIKLPKRSNEDAKTY